VVDVRSSRIWITGVGLVTALGPDVATTWPRLVSGVRGLAPLTLFDTAARVDGRFGSDGVLRGCVA
jgi:3-oxoacyl-(acyl-carrier-protein) synthase